MIKPFSIALCALLSAGCAISPPPPPSCLDDGRGLVALNPEMLTQEEIQAVMQKHRTKASQPVHRVGGGNRNGR